MRGQSRDGPGFTDESGIATVSVRAITQLARRQHGVVSRRQLLELGMDRRTIDRRVARRRLIAVRRGIYRLGPIRQPLEAEMAALLACRGRGALSHATAAAIFDLPYPAPDGFVHVTLAGPDPGPKPGIRIHRTGQLQPDELTRRHGLAMTTAARTILDVAPGLNPSQLEQVLAHAHHRNLATPTQLHSLIARHPHRPGTPALRAMLSSAPKLSRSRSERRYLEAFRAAGLPEPETNARVVGYEVDFLWSQHRLVVEIDGEPFHSTRPDRRNDLRRDAALFELGYSVLRFDADDPPARAVALVARATR